MLMVEFKTIKSRYYVLKNSEYIFIHLNMFWKSYIVTKYFIRFFDSVDKIGKLLYI